MGVAMGQVVRDEARRVPGSKAGNGVTTDRWKVRCATISTGFRRPNMLSNTYTYTVSWNSFRAAHGHLMEFGFEQPYEVAWDGSGVWYTPLTGRRVPRAQRRLRA